MLTKFDKAYVAALISFLALNLQHWAGVELTVELQAALVAVVTGLFTWWVPNKTS